MATLNSAAEGFRAVRPHFQAESSRPEKKAPLKRYFVAASVLLACLLAIILATLLLIGSPNPTWSRSEHSRLSSRLAGLADWEGSATANAPPVGQQLALQTVSLLTESSWQVTVQRCFVICTDLLFQSLWMFTSSSKRMKVARVNRDSCNSTMADGRSQTHCTKRRQSATSRIELRR